MKRAWLVVAWLLVFMAGTELVPPRYVQTALAQQEEPSSPRARAPVTFLQINDVYSTAPIDGSGGLARVATVKQTLAAAGRTPFEIGSEFEKSSRRGCAGGQGAPRPFHAAARNRSRSPRNRLREGAHFIARAAAGNEHPCPRGSVRLRGAPGLAGIPRKVSQRFSRIRAALHLLGDRPAFDAHHLLQCARRRPDGLSAADWSISL
jgi:hypothetical protein